MFLAPHAKIAKIFVLLVAVVFISTIFGLLKDSFKATILLYAKPYNIEITFTKTIKGKIISIEKEGQETFTPKSLVTMEDYAAGQVIIVNNSNQTQILVAKTRLLSPQGLLFRLANRVVVPAQQKIKTTVKADQFGEKYDIGPTIFTIPGLSPILQEKIYAESKEPMTGGLKKAGIVMQKDIDEARDLLKEKLLKESLEELRQKFDTTPIDKIAIHPELVSFNSTAKAHEEKDSFQVQMKLKTTAILVREGGLLNEARDELTKKLTVDQELLNFDPKTFTYRIKSFDQESQEAVFELYLAGQSILSDQSKKLNKRQFFGLSAKEIKSYLLTVDEIESVKIKFSPFFIKKIPSSEKRIVIKIKPI